MSDSAKVWWGEGGAGQRERGRDALRAREAFLVRATHQKAVANSEQGEGKNRQQEDDISFLGRQESAGSTGHN